MQNLKELFDRNREWSEAISKNNPDFFTSLSTGQSPELLWIGCSDSRVPPEQILGLLPGEIFVHRNIANMVVENDENSLSVITYGVEILKVKHIIVCGHYGCGGMQAALVDEPEGLPDYWLSHIRSIHKLHQESLDVISDEKEKHDRLCELNVIRQVENICELSPVKNAWQKGQELTVHGWIYSIKDGILKNLDVSVSNTKM